MRLLQILILTLFALPCFGQIVDPLLDYQVDSVLNDTTGQYEKIYVLYDTIGDVATGNYTISVQTLDSAGIVLALYEKTLSALNRVGDVEAARLNFISYGVECRSKAAEIVGSDEYRAVIAPEVRPLLEGEWRYRYAGNLTALTADDLGRFRQADNTLQLVANPWSRTWVVFIDKLQADEQIEMYRVAEDFWIGTGQQGRAILRKIN
jgi:hypothetical protein